MTDLTIDDDVFTSATPGELVRGLAGNDKITASNGGNELHGGDGDDVLRGGEGNDILRGDDFSNVTYRNVLNGLAGNDRIYSYSWFDKINGGTGDDTVVVYAQQTGQLVNGGSGTDTLYLSALANLSVGINITFGTTWTLFVGGIGGAVYTNFEALSVVGGTGSNAFQGGNGNDSLLNTYDNIASFIAGNINGGGGSDKIGFHGFPSTGIQIIDGGTGVDTLEWSSGNAASRNLVFDAAAGSMLADGVAFATISRIEKFSFRTKIGFAGSFDYNGGASTDTLSIYASSSTIELNGGNDSASIQTGGSTVNGGAGNDVIAVAHPNTGSHVLNGGAGNDTIQGATVKSTISGEDGNDTLGANNSRTSLSGGAGNDKISQTSIYSTSGTGNAVIDGGTGHDVLILERFNLATIFNSNFAINSVTLADGTVVKNFDAVTFTGGSGADILRASNDAAGATANILKGWTGNDRLTAAANGATLDGFNDNDILIGGTGADVLLGGLGLDTLKAGGGNDSLTGGAGKDEMSGGGGEDTFFFISQFETGNDAATRDVITDFSQAQGDTINLNAFDADLTIGGFQDFSFISSGPFGNAAGELRFQKFNLVGTADDYTLLIGDLNGDGTGDFQIEFSGLITFVVGDIVL